MIKIAMAKFRRNEKKTTQHTNAEKMKKKKERKKTERKLDTFCLLRRFFGSRWLLNDGNLFLFLNSSPGESKDKEQKKT